MTTAPKSTKQERRAGVAGDALDDFLDLAGHELRTPITALKGQVQLMQRRLRREPGRGADLADLGKMMYQIERLNHELDVYLEASHITRKRFGLMLAQSDLVGQIRRLVETYAGASSGHSIHVEATSDTIVGTWDARRLLMAIEVMLTNALKFSRNGDIILRVAREGDVVRVEVADRGIGVPRGERARVFTAYGRGSNAENAGAGLGLFVARETVRRHGGRMGVRTRPGGGSIFWLTVPLSRGAEPAAVPRAKTTKPTGAARPAHTGTSRAAAVG